jgi:hypothetical protein
MNMLSNMTHSDCGEANLVLHTHDPCSPMGHPEVVSLPPDCSAFCAAKSNIIRYIFQCLKCYTVEWVDVGIRAKVFDEKYGKYKKKVFWKFDLYSKGHY